jgi:SAM-dependent methyltransferase
MALVPLDLSPAAFAEFRRAFPFPERYYGGPGSTVWNEKVFEHFVAYSLCGLGAFDRDRDVYVDIAAGGSPWAVLLRRNGYKAYAVDLSIRDAFRGYYYYLTADATRMPFPESSIRAMSLQCAFEMFVGDSDTRLIDECARILAPGGSVVVVPLYLHTHFCGYSSPEYYGRRGFADEGAELYICRKYSDIPFSRKYDTEQLQRRVLSRASRRGLRWQVYELADSEDYGPGIYCHYVLRISKE